MSTQIGFFAFLQINIRDTRLRSDLLGKFQRSSFFPININIFNNFHLQKIGGGGIYFFYYVVNFVKRCALHGKLKFSFSGMKCFLNKMNCGFTCVEIARFQIYQIKMGYYLISFRFLVV